MIREIYSLILNQSATYAVLAQSYMPAQSIHILTNPLNNQLSPWYTLEENMIGRVRTHEWTFDKTD